jgi:hypothetical protein
VDNIKPNGRGGYIVGVIVPTLPDKFYLLWHIRTKAFLCKLLVRLCVLVQVLITQNGQGANPTNLNLQLQRQRCT